MAEPVETRDVELLGRLKAGDEDAFLEFYRRHQGGLYRYAMHMSGSPQAAADVVQETFLSLIRHVAKYDEEKGNPAAFLFGIARNHLRKLYEKESRYVSLSDELSSGLSSDGAFHSGQSNGNGHAPAMVTPSETVHEGLEREQISELLRDAILTLPDHYREPVTLCDLEGKSYGEAAALLDCPVGTVRSRLNRARSMLLDKLRPAKIGARAQWVRPGGNT
ncbi:MAG TPA: RNA polymerase sigma factor [Candidatus Acidoferrales bacterium]|jgi:RNA polymerase sigma-70 factor (ECF subfamily)|nr:RNA polymerase sigma factor [Candidatus Acidoferrales bacterium]